MRKHYNLSKLKSWKNPYAKRLKTPVTIRLDGDIVVYFKALSASTGLPYQNLINLYLKDCATSERKLKFLWAT